MSDKYIIYNNRFDKEQHKIYIVDNVKSIKLKYNFFL